MLRSLGQRLGVTALLFSVVLHWGILTLAARTREVDEPVSRVVDFHPWKPTDAATEASMQLKLHIMTKGQQKVASSGPVKPHVIACPYGPPTIHK